MTDRTAPDRVARTSSSDEVDLSLPDTIVTIAIVTIAAVVWIPALGRSFWLGELISTWVIEDSLGTTISRAQEYQASSPLYFGLLWLWSQIVGTDEVLLRLPSLLCMGAALWHVNALGRDLGSPLVGKIAVLLTLSAPTVTQMGISARPYAFLVLATVLSARALLRWVESGELRDGMKTGAFVALALYLHPFSALTFVAHLALLWASVRAGRGPSRLQLGRVAGLAAVLLLPLLPQLWQIAGRSNVYSYAPMPDLARLAAWMVPGSAVVLLLVGLTLSAGSTDPDSDITPPFPGRNRLLAGWAIAAPVGLFLLSHLGGSSVFVPRYYMVAVPGMALLVGLLFSMIGSVAVRGGLVILLAAVTLFDIVGDSPLNGLEHDFRGAIEQVNEVVVIDDTTILFSNGLVESNDPGWLTDPETQPYLRSIFSAYPAAAPTVALPTIYLPDNARTVDDAINEAAGSGTDTVVILFPYVEGTSEYLEVLDDGLTAEGFSTAGQRDFAGLRVLLYER